MSKIIDYENIKKRFYQKIPGMKLIYIGWEIIREEIYLKTLYAMSIRRDNKDNNLYRYNAKTLLLKGYEYTDGKEIKRVNDNEGKVYYRDKSWIGNETDFNETNGISVIWKTEYKDLDFIGILYRVEIPEVFINYLKNQNIDSVAIKYFEELYKEFPNNSLLFQIKPNNIYGIYVEVI